MRKVIIIILIVLFIAAGYVLAINSKDHSNKQIQQTQGSASSTKEMLQSINTNNWETFSSTKFKYNVKYPRGATLEPLSGDLTISPQVTFQLEEPLGVNYTLPGSDSRIPEDRFKVTITVMAQNGLSLEGWVDSNLAQRQAPIPAEKKNIQIGTEEAIYVQYPVDESRSFGFTGYEEVVYYIAHGNYVYRISGIRAPKNINNSDPSYAFAGRYEAIFQAMINSLTFENTGT